MNERDFDQLAASVKQAGAIKRGKLKPGRTTRMDPADIRMIRQKLDKSQSEFALMIGCQRLYFAELGAGTSPSGGSCSGFAQDCFGKSRNRGTVVKRLSNHAAPPLPTQTLTPCPGLGPFAPLRNRYAVRARRERYLEETKITVSACKSR